MNRENKTTLVSFLSNFGLKLIKKGNWPFLLALVLGLILLMAILANLFSGLVALIVVSILGGFLLTLGQGIKKILHMSLVPLPARAAFSPVEVDSLAGELAAMGFVPAGYFTATGGFKVALEGWVHPGYQVRAMITDVGRNVPPYVEMGCDYSDGASLEVCGRKMEANLPRPANMILIERPGARPAEILTVLLNTRRPDGLLDVRPEDFQADFQDELRCLREFLLD